MKTKQNKTDTENKFSEDIEIITGRKENWRGTIIIRDEEDIEQKQESYKKQIESNKEFLELKNMIAERKYQ